MKTKRLITICMLALVMLFAFTAYAQASETDPVYIKGRFFLESVGIDTTGMEYSSPVTRGYAANVISKTLFDDITVTPAMTKFADVAPDSPYASAAYLLSTSNIMQGDGTNFSPYNNVTYSQAAKIFISALGRDVVAQTKGGYPEGYLYVAAKDGLFDSVQVKSDDTLTFGDFAKMYYNFAFCKGFVISGPGFNSFSKDDTTVMQHKMNRCDMMYIEGVVKGNQFGSITSDDIGEITIDNTTYKLECDVSSDIIGYYANAFLTKKGSKYVVTSIITDPQKNKVKTLTGSEISNISLSRIDYYDGTRETYLKLSDVSVVRNGKIMVTFTKDDLVPLNGGLVLIDNDNDGKYEFVHVENKQYYTVQRTSDINKVVVLDDGEYEGSTHLYINPEDNEYYHRIYKSNGEEAQFSDIKAGDIIRIEGSIEQKVLRAYIIDTVVEGTVTGLSYDSDYPAILDIGSYASAKNTAREDLIDIRGLEFNSKYSFVVDGKLIVSIDAVKSDAQYAYVIDTYTKSNHSKDIIYTIVSDDNQVYEGELAEKILYNGKSVKRKNFAPKKGIVISYKTDAEGKICYIEEAQLHTQKAGMIYAEKTDILYSQTYTYPLFMSDETVVFVVPDSGELEDYMSDLSMVNGSTYQCESYDYNENDMSVSVVVIYENVEYETPGYIAADSPICILKKKIKVLDENGFDVCKLTWLEGKEEKTAIVKDTTTMNKIVSNMKLGDVFQYSITNRGYIDNINTLIRLDQNPAYFHKGANSELEQVYGKVVDAQYKTLPKGSMAKFVNVYTLNIGGSSEKNFLVTSENEALNYYFYDSRRETVEAGSFDNVMAEDGVLGTFTASNIYIYYYNREAMAVVIKN